MVSAKLVYAATLLSFAVAAQNDGLKNNVARAGGFQGQQGGRQPGAQAGNANAKTANAAAGNAAATAASSAPSATVSSTTKGAAKGAAKGANAAVNNAAAASASAKAANTAASSATGAQGGDDASLTLQANAVQSGSFFDGSNGLGAQAGQAQAVTSKNNFINFCAGQTLTNGLQITTGSCNGIVMGQIPAKTNMISSILVFPQNGQDLTAGKEFNISVQTQNLEAGSFTNADATYYTAPQTLKGGNVVGHTHITVQDLGKSLNPQTPPDPTQFAFFKGINDAGNGKGLLQAVVAGGLPAGNYRVCTMTSASNHQPVLMPVAQRGSQDDCTKFTVSGSGGTTNVAANNGSGGKAAAADVQSAIDIGPGAITGSASAASATKAAGAAAASQAANAGKKQTGTGKGKGKAQRLARLARRTFVA